MRRADQPRQLKLPRYQSFKLSKRLTPPDQDKLPGAWQIFTRALRLLRDHAWLFFGIALVYALLSLLLVGGAGNGNDISNLKDQLSAVFEGQLGQIASSIAIFTVLLGTAGAGVTANAAVYQVILVIIVSLAVIWSLRQVMSGEKAGIKQAFYEGMYPLIPFVLVLVVIGLQLLPLVIGAQVYGLVVGGGIAVGALEKFLWAALFFLLALLSLYLISSSLFASYIVTLKGMTPVRALRSASELVRLRRSSVFRKILFLPVALLIIQALVMVPVIVFIAPAATWVFFVLNVLTLIFIHAYLYTVYRELL